MQFDWTRILKGQGDPDTPPQPQERRQARAEDPRSARPGLDRRAAPRAAPPPTPRQDATPEGVMPPAEGVAAAPVAAEAMTAAHTRLGSEGLARLRARYAATTARITDQIQDPEEQGRLKEMAERLNPDAWVTDADVTAGLESYEATFEALRGTIGHRRRNPRPGATDTPLV